MRLAYPYPIPSVYATFSFNWSFPHDDERCRSYPAVPQTASAVPYRKGGGRTIFMVKHEQA
jgi:hypothetical protein